MKCLALAVLLVLSLAACGPAGRPASHGLGVMAPHPSGPPTPKTAPLVYFGPRPSGKTQGKYGSAASPYVGEAFTTTNGGWSNCGATGTGCSYVYSWTHSSGGAYTTASGSPTTTSGYTTVAGDIADTLKVTVTATNTDGSASQTSVATGTVFDSTLPAHPGGGSWGLAFDDEFSGSTLDLTKWTNMAGDSENGVTDHAANLSEASGLLTLTLPSSVSGASISSDPALGAGTGFMVGVNSYTEARVNFPGSGVHLNNWPAFWISALGALWPAAGENDVAEGIDDIQVNYHSPSGAHLESQPAGTWVNAFHVYGIERLPSSVKIYYDGTLIVTYSTDDNGGNEGIYVTLGNGFGTAVYGSGSNVQVDYVRSWT